MSSGMNMEEAKKIADKMTYEQAVYNCLNAKCVPYRKGTKIKMKELLERAKSLDENDSQVKPKTFNFCEQHYLQSATQVEMMRQARTKRELFINILDMCLQNEISLIWETSANIDEESEEVKKQYQEYMKMYDELEEE